MQTSHAVKTGVDATMLPSYGPGNAVLYVAGSRSERVHRRHAATERNGQTGVPVQLALQQRLRSTV